MGDGSDRQATGQVAPFDAIRHESDDEGEFWSARELAKALGYVQWRNFLQVIKQARIACESSDHAVSDHFADVSKMVTIGSGALRHLEDVHLSRYACYLIVQNADPEKPIVALGQTYFAMQTRRQELADIASLSEAQKRLALREQVAERNTALAATAQTAGVVTARDFAIFQDHGYMGLYAGERARDIHARKGLKRGQHILDHMGSTELAANWFRATQADDKIRREGIQGRDAANQTHYDVGKAVRRFIVEDLGGDPPEQLATPTQSVQQIQRDEQRRIESDERQRRQPALFAPDDSPDEQV
jgi:DNA-damage-inducible protein D